jgi:DNA primase
MIPQETVDAIMNAAVIEDVVGDYVELKKSGSALRGLSPFTNEKTPSFYVLPAKGIFKCFSSGKGGSLVTFLMELEKVSYPEALRMLARRYNIEIEETAPTPEELAAATAKESLGNLVAWAQKWFTTQLNETDPGKAIGRSYFVERGFRDDVLDKFLIGYSPDSWDAMAQAGAAAGYANDKLVEAGLCKQRDDGSLWDFFKGRVMFPIRDVTGRVIGFGGRTLTTDKKVAKYFNSPESVLYNKSRVLYGMHLAKPAILKEERCFLVEGYTDVMAMHQAGVENVVASSGTALTTSQIHLLRRFTKNVTVIFDGDSAGIRASLRGIDMLLQEGMAVSVVRLPEGEDPDSFAKSLGSDKFSAFILDEARDFLQFKAQLLLEEAGSDPLKRADMIRSVVESIAVIPDSIQRSVYLQTSASELGIAEDVLGSEVAKTMHAKATQAAKRSGTRAAPAPPAPETAPHPSEEASPVEGPSPRELIENNLVRAMLEYGTDVVRVEVQDGEEKSTVEVPFAELVVHRLEEEDMVFEHGLNQTVFERFVSELDQERILTAEQLANDPDANIQAKVASALIHPYALSPNWEQRHKIYPTVERDQLTTLLEDSLHRMHLMDLKASLDRVRTKLEAGGMSVEEERAMLAEKIQLDREIQTTLAHFGTVILP